MTPLHAVRTASLAAPTRTPRSTGVRDAHIRAAEILGRIIDVFETIDSCSDETLDVARTLVAGELEGTEVTRIHAPHGNQGRSAVLAAAARCVHAAWEDRDAKRPSPAADAATVQERTDAVPGERRTEAWQVLYRVYRVLDGVAAFHDRVSPSRKGGIVDVLAHMVQGPEPRTWHPDQRALARCVLEWMRG